MEPGQVDINLKTSINLACKEICVSGLHFESQSCICLRTVDTARAEGLQAISQSTVRSQAAGANQPDSQTCNHSAKLILSYRIPGFVVHLPYMFFRKHHLGHTLRVCVWGVRNAWWRCNCVSVALRAIVCDRTFLGASSFFKHAAR